MPLIIVLWLLLAALVFSALTQGWVRHIYRRHAGRSALGAHAAGDFAKALLEKHHLSDVSVIATESALDDRYDPHAKILYTSNPASTSVAALAVTAHEVGHALQHEEGFWGLRLRRWIQPAAHLIASLALLGMLLGWFFGLENAVFTSALVYLGTVLLLLFALPVELDANRRALQMLDEETMLSSSEKASAKRVLQAAALTYVGAAFSPVIHSVFWVFKR